MSASRLKELSGFGNGVCLVCQSFYKISSEQIKHCTQNKNIQKDIQSILGEAEEQISKLVRSSPQENIKTIINKTGTFYQQTNTLLKSDYMAKNMPNFFSPKRSITTYSWYIVNQKNQFNYIQRRNFVSESPKETPNIENKKAETKKKGINLKEMHKFEHKLNKFSKEREIPSGRVSRLINFGNLAAGMGAGAITEMTKRAIGISKPGQNLTNSMLDTTTSVFFNRR